MGGISRSFEEVAVPDQGQFVASISTTAPTKRPMMPDLMKPRIATKPVPVRIDWSRERLWALR